MQHVHRQIVSLQRWQPAVITQKRENAEAFPFPEKRLIELPRLPWRNLRRAWFRQVRRSPLRIPDRRVRELLYAVMRLEADVVHVFFGHIGVLLLPFLQVCPRPVVVSFHGADVGVDAGSPKWRAALEEVFRCSTLVLARSASLLESLERLGCPADRLRLQRTGVPLDAWPFFARDVPQDGAWHFVQACRLVPKKGLLTTLEAFRRVSHTYPKARLTIAGDGPLRDELRTRAAGLNVAFPGFLDQPALRNLLAEAHVFLHPSETPADGNREGVPNSLLEAMATGLPVLATRHGGIPEAVTDGVNGHLVREGDADGLSAAALRMLGGPDRYREMAVAARRAVAEGFERGRQTEVLEGIYDETVNRRRQPPWPLGRNRPDQEFRESM